MVLFLEDLTTKPNQELRRCFQFLEVDPTVEISANKRRLNAGSHKLYDSKRLRDMRNTIWSPETAQALQKIPVKMQDEFLSQLGLRQRFAQKTLVWEDSTYTEVCRKIGEDIIRFLTAYDKTLEFWPRFARAYQNNQ